jgi:hypothetical protein
VEGREGGREGGQDLCPEVSFLVLEVQEGSALGNKHQGT